MSNWKLGPNDCGGSICDSLGPSILVKGLSFESTYEVALEAYDGCWGPRGPWSKPLKLADHTPEPPGAPVIDSITEDSVRVSFSLLPDCSHGRLWFLQGNKVLHFDYASGTLSGPGKCRRLLCRSTPASEGEKGIVVSGLLPDTSYEVKCLARDAFGFSAPSPGSTFRTLPEDVVEITGTRTQAERDAELRKRAIDVDTNLDTEAPATKSSRRVKKEG